VLQAVGRVGHEQQMVLRGRRNQAPQARILAAADVEDVQAGEIARVGDMRDAQRPVLHAARRRDAAQLAFHRRRAHHADDDRIVRAEADGPLHIAREVVEECRLDAIGGNALAMCRRVNCTQQRCQDRPIPHFLARPFLCSTLTAPATG
jgi:hypothetical protein